MSKKRIAVIFGGKSSEHEVSRVSASYVLSVIPRDRYEVVTIGITKQGKWLLYSGDPQAIADGRWEQDPNNVLAFIAPAPSVSGMVVVRPEGTELMKLDAIFPVLHGKNGEDGTIQGLFEMAVTNILLDSFGIDQAAFTWFYTYDYYKDPQKVLAQIETALPRYPLFVKPANAGSSVGITKAHNHEELLKAIDVAAKEDSKIVIEENIVGYEVECAVLGNEEPIASVPGQIAPAAEFYDYDAKYNNAASELFIPARISKELQEKVREIAVKAYRSIGCSGLSRVDFFVTDEGRILLNEINTLPGFTSISMYPKLMAACGIEGADLIEKLLQSAFERNEKNV